MSIDFEETFSICTIAPTFWLEVSRWKLDSVGAQDLAERRIHAFYSAGRRGVPSRLRFEGESFLSSESESPPPDFNPNSVPLAVRLLLYDNLQGMLDPLGKVPFGVEPEIILEVYADLKAHVYHYRLLIPRIYLEASVQEVFDSEQPSSITIVDSSGQDRVLGWSVAWALHFQQPHRICFETLRANGQRHLYSAKVSSKSFLLTREHAKSLRVDLAPMLDPQQYKSTH